METISLKVESRDPQKEVAADLRRAGMLPLECYGHSHDNLHFKVAYQDFRRVYIKAGESTIIELDIDGETKKKVLVQDVSYHPVTDKITHVDLKMISMKEKLTTYIPVVFEGEAPAIKELGGVLLQNLDEIEVRCLPGDLIHEIKIDITGLAEFHDSIKVSDLKLGDKVEILTDLEQPIVSVAPPREEEPEPVAAEAAPAEGEAPAAEAAAEGEAKAE